MNIKKLIFKTKSTYWGVVVFYFLNIVNADTSKSPLYNAKCEGGLEERNSSVLLGAKCSEIAEAVSLGEERTWNLFNYFDRFVDLAVVLFSPLALIMMIYSATLYITASGNDEQIRKAKQFFVFGVIGSAVVVFSFVIIRMVVEIITKLA